jgi:hypothetical protein
MTVGSQNWAAILPDVLEHVVDQLNPLLPDDLTLMSTGGQVLLSMTGGRPRVVATETPGLPADLERDGVAIAAGGVLADIQDLVVTHLHRPWPVTARGTGAHPVAELRGSSLVLHFRAGTEQADVITLRPFPVPDDPPPVVASG